MSRAAAGQWCGDVQYNAVPSLHGYGSAIARIRRSYMCGLRNRTKWRRLSIANWRPCCQSWRSSSVWGSCHGARCMPSYASGGLSSIACCAAPRTRRPFCKRYRSCPCPCAAASSEQGERRLHVCPLSIHAVRVELGHVAGTQEEGLLVNWLRRHL